MTSARAISFGSAACDYRALDDRAFVSAIAWRKSAGARLTTAARSGDVAELCSELRRASVKRRNSEVKSRKSGFRFPTADLRQKGILPQLLQPLWSKSAWDDPTTAGQLSDLLLDLFRHTQRKRSKGRGKSSATFRRVADCLDSAPPDASPWAQVVWLTVLATAADLLDDVSLMRVWRQSLRLLIPHGTSEVGGQRSEVGGQRSEVGTWRSEDEFLTSNLRTCPSVDDRQLLITGELPWLAGLVFTDVKRSGRLRRAARSELRRQLDALTDNDGTPHAQSLNRLPLIFAVFTRVLSIGSGFGEMPWNASSARRFERLVTRAAAMAHVDGRLALSNGASYASGSLLRTASILCGLTPQTPSYLRLQEVVDDAPTGKRHRPMPAIRLPKISRRSATAENKFPSSQSDWAELACLRNNWSAGGDACLLAYHDIHPQISVTAFERSLIDGDWHLSVELDGTPIELTANWSCVCWFSDEDADYVELEQETAAGVMLMRQVLLSRTDHWLLLADNAKVAAGTPVQEARLELMSRLPLASNVSHQEGRWTRDVSLRVEKLKARAYPLGLDQERVQKADGSLNVLSGELVLRQTSAGGGLWMPLVIDWSPDRRRLEAQWRQLTVAEDGKRLPRHVACGQRLRIGKHQWLFYRSHRHGPTGRTLLGHHTPHETVVAEFTCDGEVEPIVLVE